MYEDTFFPEDETVDEANDSAPGQPGAPRDPLDGLLSMGARELPPASPLEIVPPRPMREGAGESIGRYTLREVIGEGGMGEVWRAEQDEPVRREVALKIIKAGMHTPEVVTRFEAERQTLANMDHPSIAQVFDGGATSSGRPYFVMELVEGVAITDYCDQVHCGTRGRLGLFQEVCEAVQHAHQKGVIHRDLKPGNILVNSVSARALPKVIDFGIAKATGQALNADSYTARDDELVGTLPYMSPEQAGFAADRIDTRSDVYALGVLLYELLTGATPFDVQRLRESPLDEACRVIREEDPPKPSNRLSTLGHHLATVAVHHGTTPKSLTRQVGRELDWIVMKALHKHPDRRYQSAAAFGEDIGRYLRGEPVEAGPPSRRYRIGKFVRRHQGAVAAVAAIVLTLVIATVVSSSMAVRESAARKAETRERETAVAGMAIASDAIREMLHEVGDEALSSVPGMGKLRETLLNRAHALSEELLALEHAGPEMKLQAIAALESLIEVRLILGDDEAAFANCEESRALLEPLRSERPGDRQTHLHWLILSRHSAEALEGLGRRNLARATVKEALQTAPELPEEIRKDPEILLALADLHSAHAGMLLDDGALAAAAEVHHEIIAMLDAHDDGDGRPGLRFALATAHRELGLILRGEEPQDEGERQLRMALAKFEALSEADRNDRRYQEGTASALGGLASLRSFPDKRRLEWLRQAQGVFATLCTQFPYVVEYNRKLAASHSASARIQALVGDYGAANVAAFDAVKALEAVEGVLRSPALRFQLASCRLDYHFLEAKKGDLAFYLEHAPDILSELQELASELPAGGGHRARLAAGYRQLGVSLLRKVEPSPDGEVPPGELTTIRDILRKAERFYEEALEADGESASNLAGAARCRVQLGLAAACGTGGGDSEQGIAEAIEDLEALLGTPAETPGLHHFYLASAKQVLSRVRGLEQRPAEAMAALREAASRVAEALQRDSDNARYERLESEILEALVELGDEDISPVSLVPAGEESDAAQEAERQWVAANRFKRQGDPKKAEEAMRKCVEMLREAVAAQEEPSDALKFNLAAKTLALHSHQLDFGTFDPDILVETLKVMKEMEEVATRNPDVDEMHLRWAKATLAIGRSFYLGCALLHQRGDAEAKRFMSESINHYHDGIERFENWAGSDSSKETELKFNRGMLRTDLAYAIWTDSLWNFGTHRLQDAKPWSDRALEDLSTVVRAEPKNAEYLIRFGNAYAGRSSILESLGEKVEAREAVRLALKYIGEGLQADPYHANRGFWKGMVGKIKSHYPDLEKDAEE